MSTTAHLGERVSALADGNIDSTERDRALSHVAHCVDCRADVEAERHLRLALHVMPTPEVSATLIAKLSAISTVPVDGPPVPRRPVELPHPLPTASGGTRPDGGPTRPSSDRPGASRPAASRPEGRVDATGPLRSSPRSQRLRVAAVGSLAAVVGSLVYVGVSTGGLAGSTTPPVSTFGIETTVNTPSTPSVVETTLP